MRLPTVALATCVLVAPLVLADPPQNDAGLGGDAGDARENATPLPALGRYEGALRDDGDDDWYTYEHDVGGPACVTLAAGGRTAATYTLALQTAGRDLGSAAPLPRESEARLALAGSSVSRSWAGIEPLPWDDGGDNGLYAFTLSESRASDAIEDTLTRDAGSLLSGPFPIEGACTAGRLQPLAGLGDATDLWTFAGTQGQQILYSLGATAPVTLELRGPGGAPVGPAIAPDAIANVTLPADATYTLQASALGGAQVIEYVIGLVGPDPPPGSPCRPTCWTG